MVFIPPNLALAGAQLAVGGIQSIFNNESRQAQLASQRAGLRAQNRQRLQANQRLFEDYLEYNEAITEAFEQSKITAQKQIAANNSAYQRVIESGLTGLADESDNYVARAFDRRIRLAEATGGAAASGLTGVTADLMDAMQRGAAGRATAADSASAERSIGRYLFNTKAAREQTEMANYAAYVPVSRAPRLGRPPVFEGFGQMPTDTTGMDFLSDTIGTIGSAALTYFGNMPKKATVSPNRGSLAAVFT